MDKVNNKNEDEIKSELHEHSPLKAVHLIITITLGVALLVFGILYFHSVGAIDDYERQIEGLNATIQSMELNSTTSADYEAQIEELNKTNQIISDSLNAKIESYSELSAETMALKMPDSYPLKGTATIKGDVLLDDEEAGDDETDKDLKKVEFICDEGTKIIATGQGRVAEINGNENKGYSVVIDHDNGYKSIYRSKGIIFVSQGDIVSKNSLLIMVPGNNSEFTYMISYNNEYINPMDCMIING